MTPSSSLWCHVYPDGMSPLAICSSCLALNFSARLASDSMALARSAVHWANCVLFSAMYRLLGSFVVNVLSNLGKTPLITVTPSSWRMYFSANSTPVSGCLRPARALLRQLLTSCRTYFPSWIPRSTSAAESTISPAAAAVSAAAAAASSALTIFSYFATTAAPRVPEAAAPMMAPHLYSLAAPVAAALSPSVTLPVETPVMTPDTAPPIAAEVSAMAGASVAAR